MKKKEGIHTDIERMKTILGKNLINTHRFGYSYWENSKQYVFKREGTSQKRSKL